MSRELKAWLRKQHVESMRTAKRHARAQHYGAAQLSLGHAEAYAWILLHLNKKKL